MVELGISTFGETTVLEGTGQTYSHTEHIRQLMAGELSWLTRLVWMCMELVSTIERILRYQPQRSSWQLGAVNKENSFNQLRSAFSRNMDPIRLFPTICHYRCFVKWTSGDYGWKGVFHGILPLFWI